MTNDEATIAVVSALEAANLPYMVVGSLSSNAYGISRATKDADLVVIAKSSELLAIIRSLGPEFRMDPQLSLESVTGTTRSIVELPANGFSIELFRLSNDPHDQERFRRRRRVMHPQLLRETFIPTPEDVIVTKLRWALIGGRGKDRDDVRDVIAVQGDLLDFSYHQRMGSSAWHRSFAGRNSIQDSAAIGCHSFPSSASEE